jgi:hypothetical protein
VTPSRRARIGLFTLLALLALLLISGDTPAQTPSGPPGENIIAQNGFGERDNSYAWSMGWFKGKLYVGTGRDVLCVENATVQHYFPLLTLYLANPSPNVRCAANPYNLNLRAEIWQYTPSHTKWKLVYRSRTEENPEDPKKQLASDIAYRGMVSYTDPWGHEALFAAGVSADEYVPALLETNPPRILRSYDGVHWQALNLPDVIVHYPGGVNRPMGFRSMVEFHHHLFVTATPDLTGDGAVFEVERPWSSHPGLVQVSPPNLDVFEMTVFDGQLYLGCGDTKSGYSVWRTSGYGHPFTPVVTNGAGRGFVITSVVSMHVYRDSLYVGASGWYNRNTLPISEMIKIQRTGQWSLVVGKPRTLSNGETLYPTSGLGDGFGSLFNAHFWRMTAQDGGLYVGTNSWSDVLKTYTGDAWLSDVLAGAEGYQLWATCDGEDFFPVTRNAFGISEYDFGARTLEAGGPHGEELYIGSANHAQGTMIIQDRAPACSSLINGPRTVAAPSAMIADKVGKGGTLLSWNRSPSATRYEVLAAPELNVSLYLKPPPTLPNGFQLEGATPTVTEPEAPGSVQVTLGLPGGFQPVGTTTDSYFVAHTSGRHYAYEVIAENAAGQASSPSNVQIVPSPEPAATFGSLRGSLGSPLPGVATAARAGSASRAERLLDAAQGAWQHGDRGTAMRELHRLQRLAGARNPQLTALATRLERRLEYAGAVGGA